MREFLKWFALPVAVGFGVGLVALAFVDDRPPPVAPQPRVAPLPAMVADDPPRGIPDDELVPDALWVSTAAGDTADWGHEAVGVPAAWKATKGKGVVVAVLDTGCDSEHRDLKPQILKAMDFTASRSGTSDINGHGSHCAGVVLAAENQTGMVGVAPEARLLVGKVLGDKGSGSSSGIARGIDWAVSEGADVISMSLGGPAPDPYTQAAVKRAAEAGVIVCAAAGNEGPRPGTVGYPGGYPECVCVGAVDEGLNTAGFSSRGNQLLVAAPGVNIRSCYPGDRFATMSGTSMATPYVAGVAALWCAAHPEVRKADRPAAFRKALQETARDLAPAGRDNATGFGLVQPGKMVVPGKIPEPMPGPDRVTLDFGPAGVEFLGRKLLRLTFEFEPRK